MKSVGSGGVSEALGAGEKIERARRGRKLLIFGIVAGIGLVAGFATGARDGMLGHAAWPPALSLAIAASYLVAVVGGGIALAGHSDEVERLGQYRAAAIAGFVYMLAYPIWFALWMGALAPEPMHAMLFALFWLAWSLAFIFYRFR